MFFEIKVNIETKMLYKKINFDIISVTTKIYIIICNSKILKKIGLEEL